MGIWKLRNYNNEALFQMIHIVRWQQEPHFAIITKEMPSHLGINISANGTAWGPRLTEACLSSLEQTMLTMVFQAHTDVNVTFITWNSPA